jgi:hypothetical protein
MGKHRARRPMVDPAQWRTAVVLHEGYGWTFRRIAAWLGCGPDAVATNLKRLGVRRRPGPTRADENARRLHMIWRRILMRCSSPAHHQYKNYGARGVGVDPRWKSFESFRDWALRHGYRSDRHLVLKDRRGDHTPKNCRWVDKDEMWAIKVERAPLPRAGRMIRAFGEEKSLRAWTKDRRCEVCPKILLRRLREGVAPEVAISSPSKQSGDPPLPRTRSGKPYQGSLRRRFDSDRAARMYARGMPVHEIAKRWGASSTSVRTWMMQRGIYKPRSEGPRASLDRLRLRTKWCDLFARVEDPRHHLYASVGAVGVRVCREWQDFESFYSWARDHGWAPRMCLVRRVQTSSFSPKNCLWISASELTVRTNAWTRARGGGAARAPASRAAVARVPNREPGRRRGSQTTPRSRPRREPT